MKWCWFLPAILLAAPRPPEVSFEKITLDLGANETAAFADVNGDGRLDVVSGENWYEAPRWTKHHFRDLNYSNFYIDNFSDLPVDVNGDGHIDIVSCSWFAQKLSWWENPGRGRGAWKEHMIENTSPVEFAFLVDLNNDGKALEVLPEFGSAKAPRAWYEIVNGAFVKRVVAPASGGHGIGAGDVNGDGRNDLLTTKGWYEAPADPRAGDWKFHADWDLGTTGFIHVLDINGDGRKDIVASMAHDYGIFWMEQTGSGTWVRHMIDDSWSQSHPLILVDVTGDGRPDLVTGKRYMAHNGRDPGEREPLGVYWYEYRPGPGGKGVEWTRHIIDYSTRTGGGMQMWVADFDKDGDPDILAPGKSGLYLFRNLTR